MKKEEFEAEEFDLIYQVRQSALYHKIKSLSAEIDKDEELKNLSKERDDLFAKARNRTDSLEKEKVIQEAKEKDSLLRNNKKRKEYLYYYNKRQRILNHLTAKLTQEIRL